MPDDLDPNDEVAFWRDLIEEWKTEREEPVPERMYQALELAKARVETAICVSQLLLPMMRGVR